MIAGCRSVGLRLERICALFERTGMTERTSISSEIGTSSALTHFRLRLAILVQIVGGQSELARRSGGRITQNGISQLLRDRRPMLESAVGVAVAGGVSLDWLAGRSGRISLAAPVDPALLKFAGDDAREGFEELELEDSLSVATKAEIIADIYGMYQRDRRRPDRRKVIAIIKSAA